ncbi:ribbon-helix-helix domain-containing protein [Nitrosopumilus sp.]
MSITLDSDLVKWIDQMIKIKKFANRSHGLEYAISQLKEKE